MQRALDQRIRQRAYEIWEDLGRPDGDAHQHWLTAERELAEAAVASLARPKKPSAPRKTARQAKLARARVRKMAAALERKAGPE